METRELRYFVAVAEELHFGRAAERLGMAQPPLSRAIGRLERRLGAALLTRTSRAVALTGAGEVLLREARAALDAVDAAERRTLRAARAAGGPPELVLATKAGASSELLSELLDAYGEVEDAAAVDLLLCGMREQEPMLRDGRADVALLHLPYDSVTGLDSEVLQVERQVALLPSRHPLARRRRLLTSELVAESGLAMPRWPDPDGSYPDGPGPRAHDHAQLIQLIGLGRTYWIAPESSRSQLGDAVAAVPVVDAPEVTTVIAWPPHSRSRAVAALVRAASELRRDAQREQAAG